MNEEVLDKHKICAEELPQFEKNIWNLLGKMSFCVETKLAFRSVWLHNRTFVFDHVKKRYLWSKWKYNPLNSNVFLMIKNNMRPHNCRFIIFKMNVDEYWINLIPNNFTHWSSDLISLLHMYSKYTVTRENFYVAVAALLDIAIIYWEENWSIIQFH